RRPTEVDRTGSIDGRDQRSITGGRQLPHLGQAGDIEFSDHVVVSWRTSGESIVDSLWTHVVLKDALRVLSAVAERALRIGLLVRGGMSVGQLFHGNDVVFGEMMIAAYELEC